MIRVDNLRRADARPLQPSSFCSTMRTRYHEGLFCSEAPRHFTAPPGPMSTPLLRRLPIAFRFSPPSIFFSKSHIFHATLYAPFSLSPTWRSRNASRTEGEQEGNNFRQRRRIGGSSLMPLPRSRAETGAMFQCHFFSVAHGAPHTFTYHASILRRNESCFHDRSMPLHPVRHDAHHLPSRPMPLRRY